MIESCCKTDENLSAEQQLFALVKDIVRALDKCERGM